MNSIKGIAAMLAIGAASLNLYAGQSAEDPVKLVTYSGSNIGLEGQLRATRESDNDTDSITCLSFVVLSREGVPSSWGYCNATIGSNSYFCNTREPSLISQINAMSGDDYIGFGYDEDVGECNIISVVKSSLNLPGKN